MSRAVEPPSDLRDYAAARGLDHRGSASQIGWLGAMGMSEELQFNVLRGVLPGGEHGLLFHDVKIVEGVRDIGQEYMTHIAGTKPKAFRLRDLLPLGELLDSTPLYKFPHTTAAIRIPEASGLLLGLQAARPPEGGAETLGQWTEVEVAPRGWVVGARTRGDADVIEEVARGPLTQLLAQPQPLGFSVTYRFGILAVSQAHFAVEDEVLDTLAEQASWLAREIRAICERHAEPLPFEADLPEPFWLQQSRTQGGVAQGGDGQNLTAVDELATRVGMRLEDAFAFMRGFGYVPIPGEAFGVLRGTLPGSDVVGRLVIALERSAMVNPRLEKALDKKQGGPFGCDAVLLGVGPGAPETAGTAGEQWIARGRVAVKRGVLAAWRPREAVRPQLHEVQSLVADTVDAARERGLLR